MKLIRVTFTVVLLLIVGMVWYTSISSVSEVATEYNEYMVLGNKAMEKQHYQEAYMFYEDALKVDKNEKAQDKILLAYQERYNETQEYADLENLISAYNDACSAFVYNTAYYEKAMSLKLADEQYNGALTTYNSAKDYGVLNDAMAEMYTQIKHSYTIKSRGYDEYIESVNGTMIYNIKGNWRWVSDDFKEESKEKYATLSSIGEDDIFYSVTHSGKGEFIDIEDIVRGKPELDIEEAGVYNEGKIPVKYDGEYNYIDLDGKKISGPYKYASTYKNGIAAVMDNSDKWYLVDAEGKPISDVKFDDIVLSNSNICLTGKELDKIIAKKDGIYSVYNADLSGKASDFSFEDVDIITDDQLFAVKSKGKWGYASLDGKIIIEPQYDEAKSFSNGFAGVKKGDEWLLINTKNEVVVDEDFIHIGYVTDEATCVVKHKLSEKKSEQRDVYDILVFNYKDLLFKSE